MAEEYVIRIKADASAQDEASIPVAVPSQGGVSTPSVSKKVADAGEVSAKISNMVVKGALVPAVTTAASTSVSLVGLQTGNNKLQLQINIARSTWESGSALYGSVKAGMALGGPAGAVAGAAVWGIQQATQIGATAMRHSIEYNNEQQRLGVLRDRAGLATNRRR